MRSICTQHDIIKSSSSRLIQSQTGSSNTASYTTSYPTSNTTSSTTSGTRHPSSSCARQCSSPEPCSRPPKGSGSPPWALPLPEQSHSVRCQANLWVKLPNLRQYATHFTLWTWCVVPGTNGRIAGCSWNVLSHPACVALVLLGCQSPCLIVLASEAAVLSVSVISTPHVGDTVCL